ncbi:MULTISPECIES: hypothetical protein [unclassified Leclercia]|uniref:Uncharacterized protein n=1 Tax=Leclercia barmai TaxID=2785629 RepID=A0ABS7S0N9_9ENTR|nr:MULTISPECIES: hypothetical protein [unclassified Leclercia]MBZ0060133.1 hypothetical protein [Leclercia sp. EMC7]MCM5698104.1 hypothetical protein [Leclercia sp. LTM01]MCM5702616.1 hypothetical protein [Leclercia sp. LTM14]
MSEENQESFKNSIAQQLKETLNAHRKLAEEDEADPIKVDEQKPPIAKEVSHLDPERQRLNNVDFEAEIKLKKSYGKWFLIILACQLLIMNGVFILVGWSKLSFKDDLTLQLYMGGTMTEVFGLVLVVTKYLFKRR